MDYQEGINYNPECGLVKRNYGWCKYMIIDFFSRTNDAKNFVASILEMLEISAQWLHMLLILIAISVEAVLQMQRY